VELEMSNQRKLGTGGVCFGTAMIYIAKPKQWVPIQGNYSIDLTANTYPKETRAYRKSAKLRGKKQFVRDKSLHDETVVVFGHDVSPAAAIDLLRRLANQIGQHGLVTGTDHLDRIVVERKVRQI
jgi:hypothetical protein